MTKLIFFLIQAYNSVKWNVRHTVDVGEGSFTQSEAEFVSQILEEEVLFTKDTLSFIY